ncbi:MAG: sensor histidine kinase, partial [Desulfobacterales bacterium]|nr:sensor histidine kinase [Desulfobacterales bacterium]
LSLQARKVQGTRNIRAFEDSRNRIRAMSMIHERLYQSKDLTHIDVEEYVQTLIDNLVASYGGGKASVVFHVDIDVDSMHIDRLIPCGLILNELVSNALKYAFLETEDGRIMVSLKAQNGKRELTVHDNGDGIPAKLDFMNTETLGLQIVNSLVV